MEKMINNNAAEITYSENGKFMFKVSKTLKQAALEKLGYDFNSFSFQFDLGIDPQQHIKAAVQDINELFNSRHSAERVDGYILKNKDELTRLIKDYKRAEKVSISQAVEASPFEKSAALTLDERVNQVNELGVFSVRNYAGSLRISSEMVLSLESFKKVASLNSGRINLKSGFVTDLNEQNLDVLFSVSNKTLKVSQKAMQTRMTNRLEAKKDKPQKPYEMDVKTFIEEAEYPEYSNGVWTDVGTGLSIADKNHDSKRARKMKP